MLTPSLDRGGRRPAGVQAQGALRRRIGGERRRREAQIRSSPWTNRAGGASCTGCRRGEHRSAPRASRPNNCPGASWHQWRAERRARRSAARGAQRAIDWQSTEKHQEQVQQAPVETRACAMPTRHTWPAEGRGCGERRRAHAQAHPLTLKRAVRQAPRVCALRGSSLSSESHLDPSGDDSRRSNVAHTWRTKEANEQKRPNGGSKPGSGREAAPLAGALDDCGHAPPGRLARGWKTVVRWAAAGAQMHGSQPDVAPRLRRQATAEARRRWGC